MRVEAPPLFITFIFVAGIATVGITMAVKASRDKPRAIEQFAKLMVPPAFDERFSEWQAIPLLAKKQDRLPVLAASDSIQTATDQLAPGRLPSLAVARIDVPQTVGTTVSARRHRNFCERNAVKKRKVWISSKQWSCRK